MLADIYQKLNAFGKLNAMDGIGAVKECKY
jgi:hypothetical protein